MQLLKSFLAFLEYERRYSKHTIAAYRTDLLQCKSFLEETFGLSDWEEVDARHLRRWLVALSRKGLENRTINRKIASLSSFYSFLKSRDKVDRDPSQKLTTLQLKKRLPNTLTKDDGQWKEADYTRFPFEQLRDHVLINILIQTGMRRGELIRLEETDVLDLRLRVFGKGKKERLIPVNDRLEQMITHYIEKKRERFGSESRLEQALIVTDKGKPVYPKFIYRVVKSYLETQTTLQQKSPHVLRHTFATRLANEGADLNAIKTLLGHSSLAATQIYTHTSIDRLKDVYKRAHPKGEGEKS